MAARFLFLEGARKPGPDHEQQAQEDLRRQGQDPVRRTRARHPDPVFQGRRHRLQCAEEGRPRRQGRGEQPDQRVHHVAPERHRRDQPLHQAAEPARTADPRSRDHSAGSGVPQHRRRLDEPAPGHRGRHAPAPLDHRILLQEGRAQRPDGHRRAHHRLQLGLDPGAGRHAGDDGAGERLSVGPVQRRRHHPGGLQDRVRPGVGKRLQPRAAGRRDQPRQLPPVGRLDRREAGQGPFPPRPRQCH